MSCDDMITTTVTLLERAKRMALPLGISVRDDISYHLIHDELIDEAIRHLHKILRHAEECKRTNSLPSMLSENEHIKNTDTCSSLPLHNSFELLSVNQHAIAKEVIARTFDSHLSNLRKKLCEMEIECEHWRTIAEGKLLSSSVMETSREQSDTITVNLTQTKNLCNSCIRWCESAWQHANDTNTSKMEFCMFTMLEELNKLLPCQTNTLVSCTPEWCEEKKESSECENVTTQNVNYKNIEYVVGERKDKLEEEEQVESTEKCAVDRVKARAHLTKHVSTSLSNNVTSNSKRKIVMSKRHNGTSASTASFELPYKASVNKSPLYQLGKVKLLPRIQSHHEHEEQQYQ